MKHIQQYLSEAVEKISSKKAGIILIKKICVQVAVDHWMTINWPAWTAATFLLFLAVAVRTDCNDADRWTWCVWDHNRVALRLIWGCLWGWAAPLPVCCVGRGLRRGAGRGRRVGWCVLFGTFLDGGQVTANVLLLEPAMATTLTNTSTYAIIYYLLPCYIKFVIHWHLLNTFHYKMQWQVHLWHN